MVEGKDGGREGRGGGKEGGREGGRNNTPAGASIYKSVEAKIALSHLLQHYENNIHLNNNGGGGGGGGQNPSCWSVMACDTTTIVIYTLFFIFVKTSKVIKINQSVDIFLFFIHIQ